MKRLTLIMHISLFTDSDHFVCFLFSFQGNSLYVVLNVFPETSEKVVLISGITYTIC